MFAADREGYRLRLTHDHRVRRVSRLTRWSVETEWCAAGRLHAGDRILLNDHRADAEWDGAQTMETGYLLGLLVGDGTLKGEAAVLSVWSVAAQTNVPAAQCTQGVVALMREAERCAMTLPHRSDFAGWSDIPGRGEWRMKSAPLRDIAKALGMSPGRKAITPALERMSSAACRGFLRGCFDADGSVQGTQRKGVSVRLAQSDRSRIEGVQRMLLRLGIPASICDRRPGVSLLPDGRGGQRAYETQAQYDLVISGEALARSADLVGFADSDKAGRLQRALMGYRRALNRSRFVATVESLTADGVEPVYDVQVPGINTFDANGLHAHNCGEQPLPPYGACLLGSVNLTKFVREPFTEGTWFDWDEYWEVVRVFTRMLDNVVEVNGLPLQQQRDEIMRKRRHGMGFLGLGSTLTMLRMKYGEPDSCEFTERIAREMAVAGWEMGLSLAQGKARRRSWKSASK